MTTCVRIILGSTDEEALRAIGDGSAWIAGSPPNRELVERLRGEGVLADVTIFDPGQGAPEHRLIEMLPDIELHHGPYSQDPAYSALEVTGAALTPEVRAALERYDFRGFQEVGGGFTCARTSAPPPDEGGGGSGPPAGSRLACEKGVGRPGP